MSRTVLDLTVTLRQDAALGAGPGTSGAVGTLKHVPGSMVRGALAAQWIRRHGTPASGALRERFLRLFESEVVFGPLFAPGTAPRSLSVHLHKGDEGPDCDSAFDAALDQAGRCTCGRGFSQSKGELTGAVPTRRNVHVEISPHGTAVEGHLYAREVVRGRMSKDRAVTMRGSLTGPAELLEELRQVERMRLGGKLSTHGAVQLAWSDPDGLPHYGVPKSSNAHGGGDLIVRLASPGIFVDDLGRSVAVPTDREIARILQDDQARVVASWTRWGEVGGWHAASDLPKPVEACVVAGSVLRIATTAGIPGARALALHGLGLRRSEGFGVVGSSGGVA